MWKRRDPSWVDLLRPKPLLKVCLPLQIHLNITQMSHKTNQSLIVTKIQARTCVRPFAVTTPGQLTFHNKLSAAKIVLDQSERGPPMLTVTGSSQSQRDPPKFKRPGPATPPFHAMPSMSGLSGHPGIHSRRISTQFGRQRVIEVNLY